MGNDLKLIAAGGDTVIKTDGYKYVLFINQQEIESHKEYNHIAKLATDIFAARMLHSNDEMIGKRMFVPSSGIGADGIVVVIAKTPSGYIVQRAGTTGRFEILPEFLSEVPVNYFQ